MQTYCIELPIVRNPMSVFLRRPVALLLAAASPLALAAEPAADQPDAQDVVTVKAERQHYRSLSATGATKTDALLMDLPQSVRVLTDNGNIILDVFNMQITNPVELETQINAIVGVVTNGLFAARPADVLLLGTSEGVKTLKA